MGRRFQQGLWTVLAVLAAVAGTPVSGFAQKNRPEVILPVGHTGGITSAAFSPDGKAVLTGSADGTARLWDTATAKVIRTFEGHAYDITSVAFSPDGKSVLTVGGWADRTILWDAATGESIRTFEERSLSAAFSPDGKTILTGAMGMATRLSETQSGKELCQLIALADGDWLVATPDGLFDGSRRARRLVRFRLGETIVPASRLKGYYYPGLLAAITRGDRPRAPANDK